MGRPPLKSTGNVTKVESAISNDRRHTVRDLAEIAGLGKPTVHRILKSDLKMSKASARWVPRLLSEDNGGHYPASYNCKLSDVINSLNDVRRLVRPKLVKLVHKLHYLIFFVETLHVNAEIME